MFVSVLVKKRKKKRKLIRIKVLGRRSISVTGVLDTLTELIVHDQLSLTRHYEFKIRQAAALRLSFFVRVFGFSWLS